MKENKKKFAFTLFEVLIVVVLIVVLVSMVLVATSKNWVDKEKQLTIATIGLLDTALQEYYDYTNDFPEPNYFSEILPGPDYEFYEQHNASLCVQLNLVPDSKKILGRLADSQIRLVDKSISFTDRWGTIHEQQGYLLILDAWGKPLDYQYKAGINTSPVITSAGPDRDFFKTLDNIDDRKLK